MTASTPRPKISRPSISRPTIAARVLSLPIRGWRVLSTRMTPRCRFHPSCSAYALEALERHGGARGMWLAVRRVGRCHPWNPGGFDPVPERPSRRADESNVRSPHQRPEAA